MSKKLDRVIDRPEQYRLGKQVVVVKHLSAIEGDNYSFGLNNAHTEHAWGGRTNYWQDKEGKLHKYNPKLKRGYHKVK